MPRYIWIFYQLHLYNIRAIIQPSINPTAKEKMKMKKIVSLVLAALMLASVLAGCGSSSASTSTGANPEATTGSLKVVTAGKLTVATSPDFAPMEFMDPSKEGQDAYIGFDITLAKYIADSLGLELQIMPMSFDA